MKQLKTLNRFIDHLKQPGARAIMVFGSTQRLREFLEFNAEIFIKLKGRYSTDTRTWEFPWGASALLAVDSGIEKRIEGMSFSYVEVDGEVSTHKKEFIQSRKRIIL